MKLCTAYYCLFLIGVGNYGDGRDDYGSGGGGYNGFGDGKLMFKMLIFKILHKLSISKSYCFLLGQL